VKSRIDLAQEDRRSESGGAAADNRYVARNGKRKRRRQTTYRLPTDVSVPGSAVPRFWVPSSVVLGSGSRFVPAALARRRSRRRDCRGPHRNLLHRQDDKDKTPVQSTAAGSCAATTAELRAGGRERGRPAGRGAVSRYKRTSGEHPVGLFADRTRHALLGNPSTSAFASG